MGRHIYDLRHYHEGGNLRLLSMAAVLLGLLPGAAGAATLRETLTQKLAEYCIPKDAQYCAGEEKATYVKGKCECNCLGMVYDSAQRRCADGNTSCSSGYRMVAANPSVCEAGFYMASTVATWCSAGFTMESTARICGSNTATCPAGYKAAI